MLEMTQFLAKGQVVDASKPKLRTSERDSKAKEIRLWVAKRPFQVLVICMIGLVASVFHLPALRINLIVTPAHTPKMR
jgi:uncharacterized membrane protein YdfJ with MMPL/SSD domain